MAATNLELVTCPDCRGSFEIDPVSNPTGFECPSCGEWASLGALRNPFIGEGALAHAEAASVASAQNLYQCTIAYVFDQANPPHAASGTIVSLGDRVLIATTAHSIPNDQALIALIGKSQAGAIPSKWTINTHKHDFLDVAYIEIDPAACAELGVQPVTLDRVHDAGTGHRDFKSRVIGYPEEYVVDGFPSAGRRGFCALSYGSETIEPPRWATIPYSFSQSSHIVVHFERQDVVDWGHTMPMLPKGTPRAVGMSGGGSLATQGRFGPRGSLVG